MGAHSWQLVVAPYKVIQDSLGIWIPPCRFWFSGTGFCIPGQWNRFPNAKFWTPSPRIPDSQAKILQIPESGLPYKR